METTIDKNALISKAELARSLGYPRFFLLCQALRKNRGFCETMRARPNNAIIGHRRHSRYVTRAEAQYIKETLGYLPIPTG